MARLITAGAELQTTDPTTEGFSAPGLAAVAQTGVFSISTATKRSGDASYELTAAAANAVGINWTGVASRTFYARAWFYLPALPDVTRRIMDLRSGASTFINIDCDIAGALTYGGSASGSLSTSVAAGTWFCIEVSVVSTATGASLVFRVNGTQVATASYTAANALIDRVRFGNLIGNTVNAGWKINVDDIAVNDDQGVTQNSWPGTRGRVVVLRPTADFAVGADWKLGLGATPAGAAFQAVNNVPPQGVTNGAAGSDTKQIRDAVSNAAGAAADAEFTFETFDTRMPAGSTVSLLQLLAATSETSNSPVMVWDATITSPAQAAATYNGAAATPNTYPLNWDRVRGPVVYNPAVAITAAPRARVGKRTATTNTAVCCALLLVVEYDETTIGALVGEADASFSGHADSLVGRGVLTGASHATFQGAASGINAAGKTPIQGSAHIAFDGDVAPPTAKAFLAGSSAIAFGGHVTRREMLTSTVGISFSGAVVPPTGVARLAALASLSFTADAALQLALPPKISENFKERWASGRHIGAYAPVQTVQIQLGRYNRRYAYWPFGGIGAITDRPAVLPWQAFWDASSDWISLPNVLEVDLEGNFDQKGVKQATIQIENIVSEALAGGGHAFRRGYLSPLRGYVADTTWTNPDASIGALTPLIDELGNQLAGPDAQPWFNLLNRDVRIRVWQGYGDELAKTFDGIIDRVDPSSNPDHITVTARMGKPLTDQRVFGWNHDPYIKDPVIFIGQDEADQITRVGSNVAVSSSWNGDDKYNAEQATDSDSETAWRSQGHSDDAVTEYIEIRVPAGRYSDFVFGPEFAGYELWVSVQAKMVDLATPPTLDGVAINENVWHDGGSGLQVPGANGGIAYMTHVTDISQKTIIRSLGGEFVMGDDSIIRVSMRNLQLSALAPDHYVASARQFFGRRRVLNPEAVTQKWVIVQDMADIVRTVLLWAGYHEWEVENTGIALPKRLVVNRGMTYMDIIDTVKDAIGFDFFMADPTLADSSLGVPTFRRSRVVTNDAPVATVRDTDLLTAIQVQMTDEPLAYIIRVRGRTTLGGGGDTLGGDTIRRLMYTFRPPWNSRLGGLLKHVVHTDNLFATADDVKFGAFYIALGEALASAIATIEIPAYPFIELDDHVELLDLGTGLTTRLNIRDRKSTFTAGEKTSWKMSLGGPLVDVPDVQDMVTIINNTARDA